jgi:hypothetical protein
MPKPAALLISTCKNPRDRRRKNETERIGKIRGALGWQVLAACAIARESGLERNDTVIPISLCSLSRKSLSSSFLFIEHAALLWRISSRVELCASIFVDEKSSAADDSPAKHYRLSINRLKRGLLVKFAAGCCVCIAVGRLANGPTIVVPHLFSRSVGKLHWTMRPASHFTFDNAAHRLSQLYCPKQVSMFFN